MISISRVFEQILILLSSNWRGLKFKVFFSLFVAQVYFWYIINYREKHGVVTNILQLSSTGRKERDKHVMNIYAATATTSPICPKQIEGKVSHKKISIPL